MLLQVLRQYSEILRIRVPTLPDFNEPSDVYWSTLKAVVDGWLDIRRHYPDEQWSMFETLKVQHTLPEAKRELKYRVTIRRLWGKRPKYLREINEKKTKATSK